MDALARVAARVPSGISRVPLPEHLPHFALGSVVTLNTITLRSALSCLAMGPMKRPHAVFDEKETQIVAVENAQSNLLQNNVGPLTFGSWS